MKKDKTTPILIGAGAAVLVAVGIAYAVKTKKCEEGTTKTQICPDSSVIITHTCVDGKWVSTGITCPTSPPPEERGYLTVTTVPSNASFTAQGPTIFTQFTNFISKELALGNYSYLITKVGYEDITGNFTITKDQTVNITSTLTPIIKEKLLVTYCSSEDLSAANLVRDGLVSAFDVTLIQGATLLDFENYDMVAIVGGNFAWEGCSQNLYNLMGFPPPTVETDRCLKYGGYAGAKVYGIAGWSASDTSWLANTFQTLAKLGNLPNYTACY